MLNILDFTPEELRQRFGEEGLEPYRADQVCRWIYAKGVYDFGKMTDLSEAQRAKLAASFAVVQPEIADVKKSSEDASAKVLLKMGGGDLVETVVMPDGVRRTACLSTQAGCKFGCAFCASGKKSFFRNLTAGEIVGQALAARDASPDKKLTHIVYMGIGEPFDNYGGLLASIRIFNSKKGLGIGARRMTISTCGVVPKIEAFSGEGLQVELSVSLHGPNDAVRGLIMPVNQAYPVKTLVEACRRYVEKTNRAITFEYILIEKVNASESQAVELALLLKGLLCKVNLIPYNPIEEFPHQAPRYADIVKFERMLKQKGISTTVRFSKGGTIRAACGQLRALHLER